MFTLDEMRAQKYTIELTKLAIENGLINTQDNGETNAKCVLSFINTVYDGLVEKN